ncbi:conjugal transfer protein [Halalkalibacter alkalisediminis]|uniref:Conjugal transfer protein n=1 Tax=Halalkalibacter alkalisediminis TaxID=935616 RepID=A0ABV6NJ33_9BACI|nr:conjugal transfer protein [Halalkalibacter alkalisediminis]
MKGDNFTKEYKYPIKIYHIGQIEFANGLEIRKMIVAGVVILLMVLMFFVFGVTSHSGALQFILGNWLIILVCVPAVITFVVFSMKYDYKPVIPFIKDRMTFYKMRNKAFEHFEEVPLDQFETDLQFEPLEPVKKKEG